MRKVYKDYDYNTRDVMEMMSLLFINRKQVFCNETTKAVEYYEILVYTLLENFTKFQDVMSYRLSQRKEHVGSEGGRLLSYASTIPLEKVLEFSDEKFKEYVNNYINFFVCILKELGIINYSEEKREFRRSKKFKNEKRLVNERIWNEFTCQFLEKEWKRYEEFFKNIP